MKGVSLALNTIIIIALAVIVFGILIWLLASSSTPAMDIALLRQEQSKYCSSYQERNVYCSKAEHENMVGLVGDNLIVKLIEICYQINSKESRYPRCDKDLYDNRYVTTTQSDAYNCIVECCNMFC